MPVRFQHDQQANSIYFVTFTCYKWLPLFQLDCIHHNPVSKKWQLVNDFADYEYSSAGFYEKGIKKYEKIMHINDALNNLIPGSRSAQGSAVKTPG